MRVGIGQSGSIIGDFARNAEAIIASVREARDRECDLVVFPELSVPGANPLDLPRRPGFVEGCEKAIDRIRAETSGIVAVVGSTAIEQGRPQERFRDRAVVLADREIIARIDKSVRPSSSPDGEEGPFTSAPGVETVDAAGMTFGLTIGEGFDDDTAEVFASLGASWLLQPAASPFRVGRPSERRAAARTSARTAGIGLIFVNAVGGQDGHVFDGGSFVVDPDGRLVFQAPAFEEGLFVVDLDTAQPIADPSDDGLDLIRQAIVLGIRDYVRHNGFERVLIGLSGGIDSALVATLAVEALGSSAVAGVCLPSAHSSQGSRDDALALAGNLGIELVEIPIEPARETLANSLPFPVSGVVDENLQARIRAVFWMTLANERNALVLAAGNKSEAAIGYCTLYGDTTGALAPIADLYKRDVYRLAERLADRIPRAILEKAPSAELRPGQRDEDDLPPYDVLDPLLEALIAENASTEELVDRGFDPHTVADVVRRVYDAEFKRRQLPPTIVVSDHPLGGLRIPLTNHFRR